jgi:hypothetical protein
MSTRIKLQKPGGNEGGNINPVSVTGRYVEQVGSLFTNTNESLLHADPQDDEFTVQVISAGMRDISKQFASGRATQIVELGLVYEGGDTTPTFYMEDVIVEYKKSIGVSKARSVNGESFNSIYGVTYVSVGIPEARYEWLCEQVTGPKIKATLADTRDLRGDGYVWLIARNTTVERGVHTEAVIMTENGEAEGYVFDSLASVLTTTEKNLVGCAGFSVRLKKTAAQRGGRVPEHFSIGLTLLHFQVTASTDIRAPPLQPTSGSKINVSKVASEGLTRLLIAKGVFGDKGRDSGDEEEYRRDEEEDTKDGDLPGRSGYSYTQQNRSLGFGSHQSTHASNGQSSSLHPAARGRSESRNSKQNETDDEGPVTRIT